MNPERILLVVAMEAEARPVRHALGLDGDPTFLHPAFPARLWTNGTVALATNGRDPRFDVESIATQPAVTTTLHAIETHKPQLVISAGTAGGWESRGGAIGTVYLSDACAFHDRRIAIPGWDAYGVGSYPVAPLADAAAALNLPMGAVTTGNALDAPPTDMGIMDDANAVAKEMEAAAVAWVCERMDIPFVALKAITDLVDHPEETATQFDRNLATATAGLATTCAQLVDWLLNQEGTT